MKKISIANLLAVSVLLVAGSASAQASERVVQITALNFLAGGSEPCDVKNKIFVLNSEDKGKKTSICKNSKVELLMDSNAGKVTFSAIDLGTGKELKPADYNVASSLELGKEAPMLRFAPQNPYGFSYVMAEDVSGLDTGLLKEWNELNDELAGLRGQVLTAERNGQTVSDTVLKQLQAKEIEAQAAQEELLKSKAGAAK